MKKPCKPLGTYPKPKKIEDHFRLVTSIAKKYRFAGLEYEELINEGKRGLSRALDKYTGQTTFAYYASIWIKKYILLYVKKTSLKNFHELPIGNGDTEDHELEDYSCIIDERAEEKIWNAVGATDFKEICKRSELTGAETLVICHHWGIETKKKTYTEIGKLMGVSYEWCRILEKRAFKKIKEYLTKTENK